MGFRPFCYREAVARGLTGFVLNDPAGVEIHLEGHRDSIEDFIKTLRNSPPPASRITGIKVEDITPQGIDGFSIAASRKGQASQELEVSVDLATCARCRREILDHIDRRQNYPFTNCTDCGPRYTIIKQLPYDRPKTVMSEFTMCTDCQAEYDDPADRRFHAQPNACPVCGPELVLLDSAGKVLRCNDPVAETLRLIHSGRIVAVKGLGGYHLMCEGLNRDAVLELRRRKLRPHKPLALICKDIEQAKGLAVISADEEMVLESAFAPILLLRWNPDVSAEVRDALAPLNPGIGIMLPYTPLHHLMFTREVDGRSLGPVVATSANRGEEPIIAREEELIARLGNVVDAILAHNRPIENRIDDSVGFLSGGFLPKISTDRDETEDGSVTVQKKDKTKVWDKLHLIRRARGFAPAPIHTSFNLPPALAVGAEMKGSFAVSQGHRLWLSPHIGEMTNRQTLGFFETTLQRYVDWFGVGPQLVACDMHPDYLSSRWAERYAKDKGVSIVRIQHHHAHIAAVMAEYGVEDEVIGLALDGTGFGPEIHSDSQTEFDANTSSFDGEIAHPRKVSIHPHGASAIWGCELLYVGDGGRSFERIGHLKELPLVGGETAIKKPRRMAAGVIADLFGPDKAIRMFGDEGRTAAAILQRKDQRLSLPWASSAGRLFDAVAGLTGLIKEISFEAQAPIALESLCPHDVSHVSPYPFETGTDLMLDSSPMFAAVLEDMNNGVELAVISARFHTGLALALVDWAEKARDKTGVNTVALSGGVFANRKLTRLLSRMGAVRELKLLFPRLIPANDGGLAAGQLFAARG